MPHVDMECLIHYHDVSHITFALQLMKWGIGSYLWNSLAFHLPNHPEATTQIDWWNGILIEKVDSALKTGILSSEMYSWSV